MKKFDLQALTRKEKLLLFGEPIKSAHNMNFDEIAADTDSRKTFLIKSMTQMNPDQEEELAENEIENPFCLQGLVIGHMNTCKSYWDAFLLILIGYSCISSAYL